MINSNVVYLISCKCLDDDVAKYVYCYTMLLAVLRQTGIIVS